MRIPAALAWILSAAVAHAAVDVSAVEKVNPALPVIPDKTFSLTDFGAVPDGNTLNTDAFKKAIAAVDQAGGGRLIVPKGTYRTLPFMLCSSLELHLDDGAVILGAASFVDFHFPEPTSFKTRDDVVKAGLKAPDPLISGKSLHDVAITGNGTIDGAGALWWAWSERAGRQANDPNRVVFPRANMIVINGCQRLRVAGVTLSNPSKFHLVPNNVTDLLIEDVKVKTPWQAPNTDAIDPGNCTNVLIRNCDIDTGDDDIVIKNGGSNILIENCTIHHGHGISIGSGTASGVHHMLIRNCTMLGTDNGLRIKSMRGNGGLCENIRYSNITLKDVPFPLLIDLTYVDNNNPNFKGDPAKLPAVRNIQFDHITITGSKHGIRFLGLPDSRITGITLDTVSITAEQDTLLQDADEPSMINVKKEVKPGVAPPRPEFVE